MKFNAKIQNGCCGKAYDHVHHPSYQILEEYGATTPGEVLVEVPDYIGDQEDTIRELYKGTGTKWENAGCLSDLK